MPGSTKIYRSSPRVDALTRPFASPDWKRGQSDGMMKVSTSVLPTSRASGRGDCQRVCKAPLRRDRQSDRDRRLRPLWQRNHAGQDSVQPLQVLLTSILCCQYHRGAACRNAPFTSIVAQRRHKISPARQEFQYFRHFPRFKHCKPRKKQKILADFTKNLQTDIWQEGCRVFYGAEVQKTRPPGFPRRAQCGLWVFTSRSRPGPCGGSGGPPGRGGSWRG